MPTVAEVLKSAGLSDDQIKGIDAKAVEAFTGLVATAESAQSKAELAQRSAEQLYETQIAPALNAWGQKEADLTAQMQYYKTLSEKAVEGGFAAPAAPFKAADPVIDNNPKGSPSLADLEQKMGSAFGVVADLGWKYRTLFNREMPDSPTALAAEAARERMPMADYAAKKYGFSDRERAVAEEARTKERDIIRKEAADERDKYWAERSGSNPAVRQPAVSRFSEIKKAQSAGERPDPLKVNREERRALTRSLIQKDIATNAATVQ